MRGIGQWTSRLESWAPNRNSPHKESKKFEIFSQFLIRKFLENIKFLPNFLDCICDLNFFLYVDGDMPNLPN